MHHVGQEIPVAPGDIDLLAGDLIGAVAVRNRPGLERAHVRSRLRFGQVHGTGPFAAGQLRQVEILQRFGGVGLQGLDLALAQHRAELQRQAGRGHHLVDRRRHRHGQAHAAVRGIGRHAHPAARRDRLIALVEPFGGPHHPVLQPRRLGVAGALQGGQDFLAHPAGFGQDLLDQIRRGVGKAVGGRDPFQPDHVIEQEPELLKRRAIGHGDPPGRMRGAADGTRRA
ncbi:hypothetical protein PARU111607_17705 [Palleronia rufa]